jgi:predicted nucleotidyltransferase
MAGLIVKVEALMCKNLNRLDVHIQPLLTELEQKLQELLEDDLKKVIVYGSYARNEQDEQSDLDIMILADRDEIGLKRLEAELNRIAVDITQRYEIFPSMIIKNYRQFDDYREVVPFYTNVHEQGIEVHG